MNLRTAAGLLLVIALAFSCHSPASMSAFDAASGKPVTVVAPTASQPGGWYASALSVDLSSSTTGAVIRYTTDGSAPALGSLYSAPVTISKNTILRAQAFKSGFPTSSEMAVSYQIGLNPVQVWFTSSVSGTAVQVSGSTTVGQDGTIRLVAAPASFDPTQKDSTPANIFYTYTSDGSLPADPTSASSAWTASSVLSLTGNGSVIHIKALGTKDGYTDAQVSEVTLTVNYVGGVTGTTGTGAVVTIIPVSELYSSNPPVFAANGEGTSDVELRSTVLANGTDVSSSAEFSWSLNGVLVSSLVSAQSLSATGYNTADLGLTGLPVGQYLLSCQVTYHGLTYSGTYTFAVAQE